MFIYSDFKIFVKQGDFANAKAMLKDEGIATEPFVILANSSMLLSLVFRYPDDDVYDTLKDNWDSFKDFFLEYVSDVPAIYDQTEMQSDFIKLFKQDFRGSKVVPYISHFTEENKSLYGECTFKIREWMAQEGFVLDASVADLEDNIYIVLEFLSAVFSRLAEPQNIEDWYRSLNNLYNVIDNYGAVISDEFAEQTSQRKDMPFYAESAKVLKGFIKDLDSIMEEILSSVE